MNKKDLVARIAENADISTKDATAALTTIEKTITEALAAGDDVVLTGFGTFTVRERTARDGRNPKTGEVLKIAACKVPAFKAGKTLKDAVKLN